jgi:hypothetical protein
VSQGTGRPWLAALTARFDTRVLQPPPATLPWPPAAAETFTALRDWCLEGAVPRTTAPLRIASLEGADAAVRELALQLCWERDGSLQMQGLGTAARIGLRLRTKARDLLDGRLGSPQQADDPWDAGGLITDADGLAALGHFVARRPTLMVVEAPDAATLRTVLQQLASRCVTGSRPVRLLVKGSGTAATPQPDWRHFKVPTPANRGTPSAL